MDNAFGLVFKPTSSNTRTDKDEKETNESDDSDDDANDNNDNNDNNFLKIILGTTTVSLSFYLVYSFMKRYRT